MLAAIKAAEASDGCVLDLSGYGRRQDNVPYPGLTKRHLVSLGLALRPAQV